MIGIQWIQVEAKFGSINLFKFYSFLNIRCDICPSLFKDRSCDGGWCHSCHSTFNLYDLLNACQQWDWNNTGLDCRIFTFLPPSFSFFQSGIILIKCHLWQPVKEIFERVKQINTSRKSVPKILLHTDAAQAIGKIPVNVQDLGADYLTVVGHKVRGGITVINDNAYFYITFSSWL